MSRSSFRHVLCPVNFTTFSHDALDYAVDFARAHGSALMGLYVDPREDMTPEDLSSIQAHLHKVLREASAPTPTAVAVLGDPASEIVRIASWLSADLIIMPLHGWSGHETHACGTVAEQVLRHARVPVLVVPCPAHGQAGTERTHDQPERAGQTVDKRSLERVL